jgi:hypothetical protein
VADMIPQVYPLFAGYQYMRWLRYWRIIYWSSDKPHVLFHKADGTVDQIEEAFLGDRDTRCWIAGSLADGVTGV